MEILKDENIKVNARYMAGILFKNALLNKTKDDNLVDLWGRLNEDQKETLKLGLLEALGSNEPDIIRAAGLSISTVCVLEIPQQRWLNIFDILCPNCKHEDPNVRQASLLTLGYICEDLMSHELEKKSSDYIISAFLESLENNYESPDLIKETIQGLYHSLKFTTCHFKDGDGRLIMDKVVAATKYDNVAVKEIAMQCIVEIIRLSYDYIDEFMAEITDVTMEATKHDVTEVKTQAIEVWSSIAEEESIRMEKNQQHHHIIETAFGILEEMIENTIQDLNIGNEECDEDQEWGTSVAAG